MKRSHPDSRRLLDADAGASRGDTDLIVRAAWLYYQGGMRQDAVAEVLGVSRFKVNRLLAQARERRIVRISIDHETTQTLALAMRIRERFGLRDCLVAPVSQADGKDDDAARRAVGAVAARFLERRLEQATPLGIGLGWGRTLSAMADDMAPGCHPDLQYVSLMGSLARNSATHPFDLVQRLANQTGGDAYLMPAPFIADTASDARVFMDQKSVQAALDVARAAQLYIISVGECATSSLLYQSGLISRDELQALVKAGAIADTIGKFFNRRGELIDSDINLRTPSIDLASLCAKETVLLAAGYRKRKATAALVRAEGLVDVLIIDEATAIALAG